jgi:3',5'-cyclic AMP phosphodiesterase CpdA
MQRRSFLGASAAAACTAVSAAPPPGSDFTFIHFTDTHIQPELRAAEGVKRAFAAINAIPHDFAIAGGDLVMDVFEQGPARSKLLFDLYASHVKDLRARVYSVPGNHDVYGMSPKAGVPASDPMYGKKMFEDRIGPRHQSFDHRGWHFILLDSVAIDNSNNWYGGFDAPQIDWLKNDLARLAPSAPIVLVTHIPLATAMGTAVFPAEYAPIMAVRRPQPVLELFEGRNLKAILQGHSHIREVVRYKECQIITSGAVSGNWWKGSHHGHPEGFAVLSVRGGEITWEYRTYGWTA